MATPTAAAPQGEDSQLVFMSHAPGAGSLAPRINVDESLAGKVLGKLAATVDRGKSDTSGRGSAGVGALRRVVQANDRAVKSKQRPVRPERAVDETLAGASKHVGGEGTPPIVTGELVPDPSFFSLIPGALGTPLRGWLVTFLHTLMIALALFLLELSPPLGIAACLLATVELLGFRTRLVQDACAGRAQVRWPEAAEVRATILIASVASLWCLVPALALSLGAWGAPAFDSGSETSIVARAKRLANPRLEAAGEGSAPKRAFGHHTLLELEALTSPRLGAVERTSAKVLEDFKAGSRESTWALVNLEGASPLGLLARAVFLLGFLVYPMTILCAVRLRSVYAALYPPIVLRAALTAPGAYLFVLLATLTYGVGALAGALVGLPALHLALGGGLGHLVWIGLQATYLVVGHMVLAGLLGRIYLSHRMALGWD